MHLPIDTLIITVGVTASFAVANFFGVDVTHVYLYLITGGVMSLYKLTKAKEKRVHEITATIVIGIFISVVIAPSIEIRMGLEPLSVAAIQGILVLAGELGITYVGKRLFGFDLSETTKEIEEKK